MVGFMKRAKLVLMTLLVCGVAAPAVARANTPSAVEREVAVVRVTIQQIDGQVLRATKATPWGEQAQFELGGHDLDLSVNDRNHLDMRYACDGSEVTERSVESRPRSKVVVYADEDVKITVQVIPVKVRVHGEPMS